VTGDRAERRPDDDKKEDDMPARPLGISKFTPEDVETWYRSEGRQIYLSDVVDPTNSDSMSVGFARYAPGESNEWIVTYDEALIVTKGAYTVTSADGVETTARAGEVIFLRAGTPVVYAAKEEGAEVVYVTYPHWMRAQEASEHAAFLDTFQPSEERPSEATPPRWCEASTTRLSGASAMAHSSSTRSPTTSSSGRRWARFGGRSR
jgi:ethanolamine utilization protein EutQ